MPDKEAKRYYWLKFPEDFFMSKRIKKLRRFDEGDTLVVIYLKMQLKALTTGGILEFSKLEQTFADELALDIEEKPENVATAVEFLTKYGLLEQIDENHYSLPYVGKNTGSETASTIRSRASRERKKTDEMLQRNTLATNCNTDAANRNKSATESKSKRKSKSENKNIFGAYGHVALTPEEHARLIEDYGEEKTEKAITYLDAYIQDKGYKSKDSNLTLRRWVFDAIEEKRNSRQQKPDKKGISRGTDYNAMVMNELLMEVKA